MVAGLRGWRPCAPVRTTGSRRDEFSGRIDPYLARPGCLVQRPWMPKNQAPRDQLLGPAAAELGPVARRATATAEGPGPFPSRGSPTAIFAVGEQPTLPI